MIEVAFVVGVLVLLVGFGLAALFLSLAQLLVLGVVCVVAGFCVGVPAGAYYHVKLYRFLATRGPVPREFFFRPTRFHAELEPAEWRAVVPWFAAGGAGFLLIVLGCVIVMLAVLKA